MRSAFIDELCSAAEKDASIILVVGDLGFGVVEDFATRFPRQYINAGVAEQNMMGLCAGLASEGYRVFAYSIANFPTFRCAEQIRNDIDYHQLPVTIVSVGGGLSYGSLGYSHHAIQDFALMRSMPNMLIASPGDPMEVRACMRFLINNPQPSYLRLTKAAEPSMHLDVPNVEPGVWLTVKKRFCTDTFLTTGGGLGLVFNQIDGRRELDKLSVHSLPLWSMRCKGMQPFQVNNFEKIITVEDHLVDGGFGSWLVEALLGSKESLNKIDVRALGSDVCGMVGSANALISKSNFWGNVK